MPPRLREPIYITKIDDPQKFEKVEVVFVIDNDLKKTRLTVDQVRQDLLDNDVHVRTLTIDLLGSPCSAEVTYYGDVSIRTNRNRTACDNILNLPRFNEPDSFKIQIVKDIDEIERRLRLRERFSQVLTTLSRATNK